MKNQPVLELPKTTAEIWLDVASWIFVTVSLALAAGYYPDLPDTIPTHFNASGEADKFGSKITIFILPVLSAVLVAGLVWLAKSPHKFNYLNKITPENAAFEYQRMRTMLRVLNALTSLLFLVITWDILRAANGTANGLSALFWIVFILLMVAPPLILLTGQSKKGK
ncbi:MAG: DUF1648 domain-containing protein [Haliscomenobacteraceae bacterium CHB4]|nr:DUF1648 domain-containing protein [Haliscomenobacteraceae bacterium CHB4]